MIFKTHYRVSVSQSGHFHTYMLDVDGDRLHFTVGPLPDIKDDVRASATGPAAFLGLYAPQEFLEWLPEQ